MCATARSRCNAVSVFQCPAWAWALAGEWQHRGPARLKCPLVSDVLGKYHRMATSAAYDAMVRMAQDFHQRYPLVDGQGNFGSATA